MSLLPKQLLFILLMPMMIPHTIAAEQKSHDKIVVAHRGASGYLPEHTLESKVLAHAQGADYIEQDVVMTRDGALVVLHDLTLDRVTDVAQQFPGRARSDGAFYVIDFTLEELRQLQVTESPRAESRFPAGQSRFGIHTLAEEIELIQGLNHSTGREAGLYVEIKSPWFHQQQGKDAAKAILTMLKGYGYETMTDKVFLQTFDFNELVRIHDELLPAMDMAIPLVQLIAQNEWQESFTLEAGEWRPYDYNWMLEAEGMAKLATYANGVGPSLEMIITQDSGPGDIHFSPLVARAHAAGLQVHAYTLRRDPGRIPAYADDFEDLLRLFLDEAGVDGVFTDFPDLARSYIQNRKD